MVDRASIAGHQIPVRVVEDERLSGLDRLELEDVGPEPRGSDFVEDGVPLDRQERPVSLFVCVSVYEKLSFTKKAVAVLPSPHEYGSDRSKSPQRPPGIQSS